MKKVKLEDASFTGLVSKFGSPLYVYRLEKLSHRVSELREQLPDKSKIFYSLKSNPLPSLVKHLVDEGCSLEVTSENELKVACDSKIDPRKILYGGPGKTEVEIEDALVRGVTQFSVESWVDFDRVANLSKKHSLVSSVLLRVNPSKALINGLAMSGTKSQFGFEEDSIIREWHLARECSESVAIIGFHIYYGTQMKNSEEIALAATEGLNSVRRISQQTGFVPQVVNLGGGFPWAYAKHQVDTTIDDLGEHLDRVISRYDNADKTEFWFESGRYLSASSGTLVTTVLDVKKSKESSTFVVLDSGINALGGMSGIGRIPRGFTLSEVVDKESKADSEVIEATIVGPLCSPLDCMNRKQKIPKDLEVGDLFKVENVGAYGLTASLVAFLTRPPPLEIAVLDDEILEVHQLQYGHRSKAIANS